MVTDRGGAPAAGHSATGERGALLTRIQDELATTHATRARRCPCCGRPIRAGQRTTTIYGTTVHVLCSGSRASARRAGS